MAALRSIGVRKPAALPYLVAEGILTQDSSESDFIWETYHDGASAESVEEVVTTKTHVVWSRGSVVLKVYNFEAENETITQALLTHFLTEGQSAHAPAGPTNGLSVKETSTYLTQGTQPTAAPSDLYTHRVPPVHISSRALVVLLQSQAHVFFLSGITHVVNLPFEVEKAFSAVRGLILQRKNTEPSTSLASPHAPKVPPNSFMTRSWSSMPPDLSQNTPYPISSHVPLAVASQADPRFITGPSGSPPLFLDKLAETSAFTLSEELPRLYSFTDPLAELGLVVHNSVHGERDGHVMHAPGHRRLAAINKDEDIIYVSSKNELSFDTNANDKPLLLVLTSNLKKNTITVWTAAYMEPRLVSPSRKHHPPTAGHRVRRRSSHGPTAPGTGATTPTIRSNDRPKDNVAGMHKSKSAAPTFKDTAHRRSRLTDQAVEDVLASQLNPVFDKSRQPTESRRVSSLLARADLSSSHDKSAFEDLATQRHSLGGNFAASFGASQRSRHSLGRERSSFGGFNHPRHRASTPGTTTSRLSVGRLSMDDTFDESLDGSFDTLDDHDDLDELFTPPELGSEQHFSEGLRKELILSSIVEMPIQKHLKREPFSPVQFPKTTLPFKVFALAAPFNSAAPHERKIFLYISHASLEGPLECEISVMRRRLSPIASISNPSGEHATSQYACNPRYLSVKVLRGVQDVNKVVDRHVEKVTCLTWSGLKSSCVSLACGWGVPVAPPLPIASVRLFNRHIILEHAQARENAGLQRMLSVHGPMRQLQFLGPRGMFGATDAKSRQHQMQLRLLPADPYLSELFKVLILLLPDHIGDFMLQLWWDVRRSISIEVDQTCQTQAEWTAFITSLFTLAQPFLDEKSRRVAKRGVPAQRRNTRQSRGTNSSVDEPAWHQMCERQEQRARSALCESLPWRWMQISCPPLSTTSSPPTRTRVSQFLAGPAPQNNISDLLVSCVELASRYNQSPAGRLVNEVWKTSFPLGKQDPRILTLSKILIALHLYREEQKLDVLAQDFTASQVSNLAPVLAQLGHWLRWERWGRRQGDFYELDGGSTKAWLYDESNLQITAQSQEQPWPAPPSILQWLEAVSSNCAYVPFPTLASLIRKAKASPHSCVSIEGIISSITPRTVALQQFFRDLDRTGDSYRAVELIAKCGISPQMIATLPEAAQAPLLEYITRCQISPPANWPRNLIQLVRREDLDLTMSLSQIHGSDNWTPEATTNLQSYNTLHSTNTPLDIHVICQSAERSDTSALSAEVDRHSVTRLIFKEDRRYMEAYALLEPTKPSTAYYSHDNRTEDAAMLEGQKQLVQWVMIRTFSLPPGNSMLKYSSRKPLLTEKFALIGFSTSCVMKPMGNVVTADRTTYSEEKYFWAFFNQGVSAGLSISREARGVDTSWIMYNKPAELSNRHAGLLLGLGLNGHLKHIAKWLSFKYLTPKHTMTSVGLLLGLSASYMGTMDTLITRLLSVHVTRMLPPGAAELNLSSHTQTTGLMGIGLLYYNTQHRRMSEVMLSEIEQVDSEAISEQSDTLRDEAYRLAAGFALGFINIGQGDDLRGLHDMRIVERLLSVAVAPKPVDIVHVLDQATAGAVVAIILIFMKTHDLAVARKVDVPDTLPQFDYVRSDICLLRTLAKHLIMWNDIRAKSAWIVQNLPSEWRSDHDLKQISRLRSDQMPFFHILAGLLWAISLKYAGSGNTKVRDFLIRYLDQFMRICRLPAVRFDSKLARNTVRNCQDLLALSAATVMAGTGDLETLRRLRALHGRVGPDVPYGSHMAAHMAIGALFLGGGTYTFGTSNQAIAALLCAFYPIFPTDVQDSRAHLQAFRHFWVLAAEPRCLVLRDVDTGRALPLAVTMKLKDGDEDKEMMSPCLVPELNTIAQIETNDPTYWPARLSFELNPFHLKYFQSTQTLMVRRRSPHDQHSTTFSATLTALNDLQSSQTARLMWDWLFTLPSLIEFEKADIGLMLPTDLHSSAFFDANMTLVDHRLVLRRLSQSWLARDLWELKGVFAWLEGIIGTGDGRARWLGKEVLERIRESILERGRGLAFT